MTFDSNKKKRKNNLEKLKLEGIVFTLLGTLFMMSEPAFRTLLTKVAPKPLLEQLFFLKTTEPLRLW